MKLGDLQQRLDILEKRLKRLCGIKTPEENENMDRTRLPDGKYVVSHPDLKPTTTFTVVKKSNIITYIDDSTADITLPTYEEWIFTPAEENEHG